MIHKLEKKQDDRGFLVEVSPLLKGRAKHFFLATLKPGKSRGNHFHKRKTEWVIVTQGKVLVKLIDINSGKISKINLTSEQGRVLEILPNFVVRIENHTDQQAAILAIFDEVFDLQDPDVWLWEKVK